ncbi:uncharacterized protein BJ171DRAFT_487652 [Polychytrium aggregatum]|uniref:uncharacterized protein n=1 Tax=Polychytrium aggregatum TaxID=110093 RepID=UPI0022FE9A07|nr:uncharacterized protein BJ171DRAFT_487652 [Polychytrium aggregatum]KAI9208912.1 hypothetical protein BJ171DRAFT_487652 [Polychytrium aggregatum]
MFGRVGCGMMSAAVTRASRAAAASPKVSGCLLSAPASKASFATAPAPSWQLNVTEKAASQINAINQKEAKSLALRVAVDPGGCHGYQYKMELTDQFEESDRFFEKIGAKVVVDPVSLELIDGSTLDYVEELIGSSFQLVDNPKAETACGCKTSFSIKI